MLTQILTYLSRKHEDYCDPDEFHGPYAASSQRKLFEDEILVSHRPKTARLEIDDEAIITSLRVLCVQVPGGERQISRTAWGSPKGDPSLRARGDQGVPVADSPGPWSLVLLGWVEESTLR
ncbi:uncharacterized protein LOC143527877 isoform X2 [Brachyhypopomus gauderio]|uniref:uncharacterized protein LOC143527877 isoform X2 n=1 Tax=Brachyhypopomus gauderio TaxID=698409 RepID=UPI0040430F4E